MVENQRKTSERISSLSTEAHRSFRGGLLLSEGKVGHRAGWRLALQRSHPGKDESRDRYMESVGLKVLRFSDTEVFENLPGVIEEIWNRL